MRFDSGREKATGDDEVSSQSSASGILSELGIIIKEGHSADCTIADPAKYLSHKYGKKLGATMLRVVFGHVCFARLRKA